MSHYDLYINIPILSIQKLQNKNIDSYVLILVPWYPVLLIKEKGAITATVKRCGATFINKEEN